MIKEKILSLIQPNKQKTIENDNIKVLLPELPFYGKDKSICSIIEAEECFYKIVYNIDGTINNNKIPVPKKQQKNLKFLLKDYYNDADNYLKTYQSKYLECENFNGKPTLTNKQFYALAIVTSLAAISSIPFLFTTTWAGIIFGTISTFSLYIVCDIHKKDINNIKTKEQFKKEYKKIQINLTNYRSGNPINKEIIKETIYTEIDKKDYSNVMDLPKVKVLSKEEEAA